MPGRRTKAHRPEAAAAAVHFDSTDDGETATSNVAPASTEGDDSSGEVPTPEAAAARSESSDASDCHYKPPV